MIHAMKLLIMWALGVPLLVGGMVVARNLPSQPPQASLQLPASAGCLGQDNLHMVQAAVPQQRNQLPCDGRIIQ